MNIIGKVCLFKRGRDEWVVVAWLEGSLARKFIAGISIVIVSWPHSLHRTTALTAPHRAAVVNGSGSGKVVEGEQKAESPRKVSFILAGWLAGWLACHPQSPISYIIMYQK